MPIIAAARIIVTLPRPDFVAPYSRTDNDIGDAMCFPMNRPEGRTTFNL